MANASPYPISAVDAPGPFKDAFVIQNFATKKCLASAEPNRRRNAQVGVGSCRSGNALQQWTASPLAGD
ncbi:hypothetical protein [Nonomuraea dietziae]|uniref:hypothetical protein n=1 Tax=Nonomuraea dietziae TaxID=65515 RepID=UPI0033C93F89